MPNTHSHWDYIFVGLGASAGTLIEVMHQRGDLMGKRILTLDPDEKTQNDKTFCYWSEDSEEITGAFADITSKTWDRICVNNHPAESITPKRYRHIQSDALYRKTQQTLESYGATIICGDVKAVTAYEDEAIVETQRAQFLGRKVFDSRPPALHGDAQTILLWQSFIGFRVTTPEATFEENTYTMMDFDIPQNEATQFVYILPFTPNEALIELTRFGSQKIDAKNERVILEKYIQDRFGTFTIQHVEEGAIPMTNQQFKAEPSPRIIKIGTAAGQVKPSTGYSFSRSYDHARQLAENNYTNPPAQRWNRFQFYDTLLLTILWRWANRGAGIFTALFRKISPQTVLQFLDEKTAFSRELQIFASLPPGPFLRAWARLTLLRARHLPYLAALAVALIYSGCLWLFPDESDYLKYGWIVLGMAAVGIPHGALDHEIMGIPRAPQPLFFFTLKYLTVMMGVVLLWMLFPIAGLALFLGYSILHFGQTDAADWGGTQSWGLSIAWGTSVFGAILLPHMTEVNQVISAYGISALPEFPRINGWVAFGLMGWAIFGWLTRRTALIAAAAILALTLSFDLVMAFSLYFIGIHSSTVWRQLKSEFNTTHRGLYFKALPYTIGAFALLATAFFYFEEVTEFWPLFFVFLAAISLPHTLLFAKWYQRDDAESSGH